MIEPLSIDEVLTMVLRVGSAATSVKSPLTDEVNKLRDEAYMAGLRDRPVSETGGRLPEGPKQVGPVGSLWPTWLTPEQEEALKAWLRVSLGGPRPEFVTPEQVKALKEWVDHADSLEPVKKEVAPVERVVYVVAFESDGNGGFDWYWEASTARPLFMVMGDYERYYYFEYRTYQTETDKITEEIDRKLIDLQAEAELVKIGQRVYRFLSYPEKVAWAGDVDES